MTWTIFACETVTGKRIGVLDGELKSWARGLGGSDAMSVQINAGALTTATRDNIRNLTTPQRMTLVADWNGVPVVACPILARPQKGTSVTITGTDIRKAILKKRKLTSWTAPFASQVLSYTNESLGSIAVQAVQVATAKPGGALPIVYPTLEADTNATHQRSYKGYELKDVDSVLTDLTGVINGPDIDFMPQWVDATRQQLQWVMRVGTDEQPQLYSPNAVRFNYGVPRSSVVDLSSTDDASQMVTDMWALGSGSDVSTGMSLQHSSPSLTALGWPLLEGEEDDKSITLQPNLDAFAQGQLATFATPTEQWGLKVNGALPPQLGTYLLGDIAIVRVRNHLWIPDGAYTMRMVAFSGDNTTTVTVAVQ
ncbi:hypothetical protein [Curtobacterium oceanosedimentum]|uniref:hypothetical protein n=1 Tax=Curtobacterium oceanosedimentum TaxID=465820 RepID=UPI003397C213